MIKRILFALVLLWILTGAAAGWAGPATDALRGPIDRGIEILKDPKYAAPEMKAAQRDAMWEIIKERSNAPEYWRDLEIVTAELSADVGLLGAVALAVTDLTGEQAAVSPREL